MGYQTTIVINNDNLDVLEDDPLIGRSIVNAILKAAHKRKDAHIPIHGCNGNKSCIVGYAIESHRTNETVTLKVTDMGAEII